MKTRFINILANAENGDIMEEVRQQGAPCIILWNAGKFVATIRTDEVYRVVINEHLEEFKSECDDCILVYTTKYTYIQCRSIHFINLKKDIHFVYSKCEEEFIEQIS